MYVDQSPVVSKGHSVHCEGAWQVGLLVVRILTPGIRMQKMKMVVVEIILMVVVMVVIMVV